MGRNNDSDTFNEIIFILIILVLLVVFLNLGLISLMSFVGFKFKNPNLGYVVVFLFIIFITIILYNFARIKEYFLINLDTLLRKENLKILHDNFEKEYKIRKSNYQILKSKIDEINKIF